MGLRKEWLMGGLACIAGCAELFFRIQGQTLKRFPPFLDIPWAASPGRAGLGRFYFKSRKTCTSRPCK